jgi:hypothetical protein
LCIIAFVCGIHTVVFGHSRYHLPLIPLILIFTSAAVTHWPAIWRRRFTPKFGLAVALCGVLIAGWMTTLVAGDWDRIAAAFQTVN